MKNNLFDAHVKEHLANARPDVPPHIWENILAKKERKKPVGFWFNNFTKGFLTGLIVLSLAGIAFYFYNTKNALNKQTNIAAEKMMGIKASDKNLVTDKISTRPVLQQNTKAFNLDNKINSTEKNPFLNKNQTAFKPDESGKNVVINSFLPFENNTEPTPDILTYGNTINRQNFHYALFKSGFFNPQLQIKKLPVSPFIPCPEIEKNAAGSKRYLEVYAGPDYVFRSISDTANSVYLQQRKTSIKYLFAYSAGIRYTRVFGSGMSFRTGLNYSQINEQFTSQNGRVIQNIYIINSNGDTTGTYLQSGTLYKTSTNKYKSIDIPISVGYEVGNGRIHSNINVGAMININSSQKGFVLDKNGIAVDITSGKSSSVYQYKTKAGVSFIGAASVYYKLNDKLHLMAEPYIKFALSSSTKPEISLKEKFHTAGLRLGVRIDF